MKFCPECDAQMDDSHVTCPRDGTRLITFEPQAPGEEKDPLVGTMLTDRLRIDRKIGQGGMGAVYKGEDVLLGRTVAIKVLATGSHTSIEDIKRFFHEARVVAKLRHPNTIQVFDFGESPSRLHYIAMEFMTGEPLDTYMESNDLSLAEVLEVIEQVCLSLDEAHAAGIVHRDLKPENIFIDNVNNRRLVKVIDFGIAKLAGGEKLTQAGMVFGTPAYMSPEQARGDELDARSDIYSLGVVLFHLLTGSPPFTAPTPMEVAIQHITREAPPVGDTARFPLPEGMAELVQRMLRKDRNDRPASVVEVRDALREVGRRSPDVSFRGGLVTGASMAARTGAMRAANTGGVTSPAGERTARGGDTSAPVRVPGDDSIELASVRPASKVAPVLGGVALLGLLGGGGWLLWGGGKAAVDEAGAATSVESASAGGEREAVAPDPTEARATADAVAPGPGAGGRTSAPEQAVDRVGAARDLALAGAVAATIEVELLSTPQGARVATVDGRALGNTPLVWRTARQGEPIEVHFELDGFDRATRSVQRRGNAIVEVALVEERRAATPRDRDRDRDRAPAGGREPRGDASSTSTPPSTTPSQDGGGTPRRFGGGQTRDPVTLVPTGN